MPARIRVERVPSAPRESYEAAKEVARALELPLSDARALLSRAPFTLPCAADDSEAARLVTRLTELGAAAHVAPPRSDMPSSCSEHLRFDARSSCSSCGSPLCIVCETRALNVAAPSCASCTARAQSKKRRYRARLLVWGLLLLAVSLYGLRVWRSRRIDWREPTRVALVLLTPAGESVDPSALEAFRERVPALEERLREEAAKYLPASTVPFRFSVVGPIAPQLAAPKLESSSLVSLARFNFDLWRFATSADSIAQLNASDFDVRIYVHARRPALSTLESVEGLSLDGGSIGVVEVELAPDSVDFALFVAAHELMHTRGASDKYGPDGLATFPSGYADPRLAPLYPQSGAEVMARGRPLSPHSEAPPIHLAELTVGPETAREIAWLSGPELPSAPQTESFEDP